MNVIGEKVIHSSFGEGTITDQTNGLITISFPIGDKKFIYPDAFKSFISIEDTKIKAAIDKEIQEAEAKKVDLLNQTKQFNEENAQKRLSSINHKQNRLNANYVHKKRSSGHQYFFVFQNKTFDAEYRGGYLWAPKYNANGYEVSHWKLMQDVREGDIIFHSVSKNIEAISIAISDYYSDTQPNELKCEKMWDDEGWRVDCQYIKIRKPIVTSDYMETIMKLQPRENAPFNIIGRGNTGYLFSLTHELSKFLFDKLCVNNNYLLEYAEQLGLE